MTLRANLFLLLFLDAFCSVSAQTLSEVRDFGDNPGNLRMFTHVSKKTEHVKKALVVVLHGCTQTAGIIAAQTGWNKLADEYDFHVIYPQQKMINNPERCFCWYRKRDVTKGRGEDASIIEMIAYMKKNYSIDSSQVFVTGLSAGAIMSVALLSTNPETFNAGAIFAGAAYKSAASIFTAGLVSTKWIHHSPKKWDLKVRKQNPNYTGAYPRMIIYQGQTDFIVNRNNGTELMKQWTHLHRLDTTPSTRIYQFAGVPDLERETYGVGKEFNAVVYYKVKKLGHAYLINPGACINEGGKRGIFSRDKNYHATWWTAMDFGLIPSLIIQGKSHVQKGERQLVYSVAVHAHSSYQWSYPAGCKVSGATDGPTLTLDWTDQDGNLNVVETDSSGCRFSYITLFVTTGSL
jgi:poly(hydroxyalkanoate) depolymerase family esterase